MNKQNHFLDNNHNINNMVLPSLEEDCINILATEEMSDLFITENEVLKSLKLGQEVDVEKVITKLANGINAHKIISCAFLDNVNLKIWSIETNNLLAFQNVKKEDKAKRMK